MCAKSNKFHIKYDYRVIGITTLLRGEDWTQNNFLSIV